MYRALSTSLRIDSDKANKYFAEHPFKKSEIATKAGVSASYLRQAINHGYTNKVYWWAVCDVIGVPRDYFDYHEPEPEPEPVKEEPQEKRECLVDLADIQYSLNIFESKLTQMLEAMVEQNNLLSEQSRLLRGKLERAERSSTPMGNTNAGEPMAFMVKKERL